MKILIAGSHGMIGAAVTRHLVKCGKEFLLSSRRIQPAKLLAAGYCFRFPELGEALRHEMEVMNAGLTSQPA